MKNYLKYTVPAVCIIIVAVTFILLFRLQNKVEKLNYGTKNIAIEKEDNLVNNVKIENQNKIENEIIKEMQLPINNTTEEDNVVSEDEDKYSADKQEKAINILEDYWGIDSTVYFTNEGILSDGEYIVAVRQKSSTAVKEYFLVNIETEEVEIYY